MGGHEWVSRIAPAFLLRPRRLGKIILGDQQVTLLGNTWRVAEPRADHVQWELALEFCLQAGSPLLKPYRIEGQGNSASRSIPRN